mmetsp:Transcript_15983/g.30329  ORF Transcript_15983/g.30329 Transcript_15983/m.30329 type:complete len:502 (-) Transcript_15983:242-1747(-)|eukprot:CAMPEP_0170186720 /NCGR_PEP_ID=MMETSP0040_2-20121228/40006_1 /TAXON_ID=641309 /ORGANISM="Lotharella oceanica, Strain CCMP622" /LENGTH=501 /DNA_ID=CAMNT_0010433575 /DNA_START=61 /DNA_END=1566 /DNA_ORIENTATION=+
MASIETNITKAEGANVDDVALRIAFRGAIHEAILEAATFEALRTLLAGLFGAAATAGAKIRYLDEDEDRVLICTTDELQEAIEYASELGTPLEIDVEVPTPAPTKVMGPEPKAIDGDSKTAENGGAKAASGSSVTESPNNGQQQEQDESGLEDEDYHGSGLDALLKDKGFVSTLADALQLAADLLIAGESSPATVLDSVLAAYPSLGRQPQLARGLPFARAAAAMLPKELAGPPLLEAVLEAQATLTSGGTVSPQQLFQQFKAIGMRHMADVMGKGGRGFGGAGAPGGGGGGFDPMQALNMISMFTGLANGGGAGASFPPGGFGGFGGFHGREQNAPPSSWSPDQGFRSTESAFSSAAKGNQQQQQPQGDAKETSSPAGPSGHRLGGDAKSSRLWSAAEYKSTHPTSNNKKSAGGNNDAELAKALALSLQDHQKRQQADRKTNAATNGGAPADPKLAHLGDQKMRHNTSAPPPASTSADDADRDLQKALAMSLEFESKASN